MLVRERESRDSARTHTHERERETERERERERERETGNLRKSCLARVALQATNRSQAFSCPSSCARKKYPIWQKKKHPWRSDQGEPTKTGSKIDT